MPNGGHDLTFFRLTNVKFRNSFGGMASISVVDPVTHDVVVQKIRVGESGKEALNGVLLTIDFEEDNTVRSAGFTEIQGSLDGRQGPYRLAHHDGNLRIFDSKDRDVGTYPLRTMG
jgi:hypothetical protein